MRILLREADYTALRPKLFGCDVGTYQLEKLKFSFALEKKQYEDF